MATYDRPAFRHYLREVRELRGLTQGDVAKQVGVPKSVISRYETGQRRVHLEMQLALCWALGITPYQLFKPAGTPSIDAWLDEATEEERNRLVNMARIFLRRETVD